MGDRITVTNLRRLCESIASDIGKPGDRFAIESANGGYQFTINDSNTFRVGYRPAREVYDLMHAYWQGWRDARRVQGSALRDVLGVMDAHNWRGNSDERAVLDNARAQVSP